MSIGKLDPLLPTSPAPSSIRSLESYRAWIHSTNSPRSSRTHYCGGMMHHDLEPEELETHNKVRSGLVAGVSRVLDESDSGELIVWGMTLVNECADLATHPDAMICLWESLRIGRVKYAENDPGSGELVEIVGSPDIVIEVVSDSSSHRDTHILKNAYYRAGVGEYWLIDARGALIDFRILKRGRCAFEPVAGDRNGFAKSEVVGRVLRMTRHSHAGGRWRCSLEYR